MQVTVKLFASFRDNRFREKGMSFSEGTTVIDIIRLLEINPAEVGVTMINFRHCQQEQVVAADDIVAIFPMIGGG